MVDAILKVIMTARPLRTVSVSKNCATIVAAPFGRYTVVHQNSLLSSTSKEFIVKALKKRLDPGLRTTEDQRMDVMRALVSIHRFQIGDVAHDVEFVGNAVAAMHVTRDASDIQCLAAIVALEH